MKRLLLALLFLPSLAFAQSVPTIDQFTSTTSPSLAITQRIYGKAVRLTGLENLGCIGTDANGILGAGTCTGGSGGTGVATTSLVASFPIVKTLSSAAITFSFSGLASTSPWTIGNLAMVSDLNHITSVATGTESISSPLTGSSFSIIGSGGSIGCQTASASQAGCLSSSDWSTFNSKISFAWPFTPATYGTQQVSATSTILEDFPGFVAATTTFGTVTATSSITNLGVKGALVLNSATGLEGAYGGASACGANNFVTTISAIGATTCGTASISGVSLGSNLNSLSVSGSITGTSYNGSAAVSNWALNMANANSWTAKQTFVDASTTAISATNENVSGQSMLTNASTTKLSINGVAQYAFKTPGFQLSTTTTWTGSTTQAQGQLPSPFTNQTINSVQCYTDAGTVNVDIFHTSTHLALFNASTTEGTITFASNNTMTAGEKWYVVAGTPASSPTSVACTFNISPTGI